jgi:excisionase family DNA binding protein
MAEQMEWLDSEQAAQLLQVSLRTLVRWAREKKVPATPFGGPTRRIWRFRREDFQSIIPEPPACRKETE